MGSPSDSQLNGIFQGPGEMRALCRALDWSRTELGPVSQWPQSLRTTAQIVLASPFPNIILWGPNLIQLYNDGYREIMGNKHPTGLGQPTQQTWPEVWHINEPIYQRVWGNESLSFTNALFPITRSGQLEDAWFTLAYSPVLDESAQVGGILVTVFDTTDQVREQQHREQIEHELQQSEQRFGQLVKTTSAMIYTMGADWKHMIQLDGKDYLVSTLLVNDSWIEQYIPLSERPTVWAAIQQAIAQKIPFEAEHQVMRRDGSVGWVSSRAIPILDKNGQIQQWVGAANDITERKRFEQQQAYLLALTDALRSISDPVAIEQTVTRIALHQFAADRCYYCRIEAGNAIITYDAMRGNLPSVAGTYPLSSFALLQKVVDEGQPFIVHDAATTPILDEDLRAVCLQLHIISFLDVPIIKNGQAVGVLCLVQSTPRNWAEADVHLAIETAERTWAAVERARSEEALQASERFVQGVIRSLPMVIYIFDLVRQRNRYLSPQVTQLFGYTVEEMQTADRDLIDTFFHPDDRPRLVAYFEHMRTHRPDEEERPEVFQIEYRVNHRYRGWVWVESHDTVYARDTDGTPTLLLGTAEDISERKANALARQESEKRLRLAVEAARMATWEWDLIGNQVYWNEKHFQLFGMEPQPNPLPAEAFLDHLHPADAESIKAQLQAAVQQRTLYDAEFRIVREEGTTRWMSGYGQVTAEQNGRPIQASGVMFDITERKQAQNALQQSEERFRTLLENLPDYAIFRIDPTGLITEWTSGAEHVTGYTTDEALGQHLSLFYPPEAIASGEVDQELAQAVTTGRVEREGIRLRKTGEQFWINEIATAIYNERGDLTGFTKISRDITGRKQMEETLRVADRRKDEFLAMLAHELRNPMTTIRNGLQILALVDGKDETSTTTIDMMNRQTDHLVRMVDDLLDVSRITRGKIDLRRERLNLVDLVQQAVKSTQPLFEEQGKLLQVSLPSVPVEVEGDATRLTQIIINLLTNGVRYTLAKGRVWLKLEQQEGSALNDRPEAIIQVRDNGIGLAADQLSAIFELFVQVDNSLARSHGGLGLGLTLVKQLVEMHHGRVEAWSEGLGKGSTFTVHLPTLPVAATLANGPTQQVNTPSARQRILVVDDNADAALTLSMLLTLKGYEVHTRNSGQAGLEAAESLRPAAILLDIGMPGMNGYETCRLIRQQPWGRRIVVIALTGYGQYKDQQQTYEAGFNGHLVKPVDLGQLTDLLAHLLATQ